jgi:hypothetical protein
MMRRFKSTNARHVRWYPSRYYEVLDKKGNTIVIKVREGFNKSNRPAFTSPPKPKQQGGFRYHHFT